MTVHMAYQTLVSDYEFKTMHQLTEAALLTLENDDTESTQKNLTALMGYLADLSSDLRPGPPVVTYGTVSVGKVTIW